MEIPFPPLQAPPGSLLRLRCLAGLLRGQQPCQLGWGFSCPWGLTTANLHWTPRMLPQRPAGSVEGEGDRRQQGHRAEGSTGSCPASFTPRACIHCCPGTSWAARGSQQLLPLCTELVGSQPSSSRSPCGQPRPRGAGGDCCEEDGSAQARVRGQPHSRQVEAQESGALGSHRTPGLCHGP